jgi:hypothetical protein
MRFLVAVIDDGTNTGTPDEMEKIDAFNQMLRDNGHFVLAWGLEDPAQSTVIDNRSATPVITKGPVVTAKEFMAGFWIIDAASDEQALELASQGSKACNRKVEVRAFHR